MNKILAWHFLPMDGKIAHKNRRKVEVGKTYSVNGDIEICSNGMHGSRRILDALSYVDSALVERVEIWGDVIEQDDKLCGRHRACLALGDITNVLHEFACVVAEDALQTHKVQDKHSWAAIDAKRKWIRGEITDEELAAAWDAAGDAAWAADRAAAWTAAWAAAGAVAWDAAGAAAWAAARAAAGDAGRTKYNTILEKMVCKELNCD